MRVLPEPHNRHRLCRPLAAAGIAVLITIGCSDSGGGSGAGPGGGPTNPLPPPPPPMASVDATAPRDTLVSLGESMQLAVTATDSSGTTLANPTVQWSVDRPAVLAVDASGTVTAQANGRAVVTATVGNESGTVAIIVSQRAATIEIAAPADSVWTLLVRARYSATAADANGNAIPSPAIQWESSDTGVATAAPGGRVTPLAEGTVEIRVRLGAAVASHTLAIVEEIPLEIDRQLAEAFQWALEDSMSVAGAVGAQAAVLQPCMPAWTGTYGRSDPVRQMHYDMALSLGSTTKTMNAGMVLRLVDEGVLTLDDTIGDWLPPINNVPPEVTLRQLLQNTSGIASFTSSADLVAEVAADPNHAYTQLELAQRFIGPQVFPPGQKYTSSNSGYLLAGLIAETATGESLTQLFRTRVLDPAAFEVGFHHGFEAPPRRVATTWNGTFGGPLEDVTPFLTSSWTSALQSLGVRTSAFDIARYAAALFAGDFLSPATRAAMMTPVPDDGKIGGQIAAGLGVRQYNYLGREQWGHSGAATDGASMLLHDTQSGITVAVTVNQNPPSIRQIHFVTAIRLLQIALNGG